MSMMDTEEPTGSQLHFPSCPFSPFDMKPGLLAFPFALASERPLLLTDFHVYDYFIIYAEIIIKQGNVPHDPGNRSDADHTELATRAAWLYYEASLTQAQISTQLRLAPARVQRLIAQAARDGLVRILIEGEFGGCLALERALIERFSLSYCRVVPALPETGPTGSSAPSRLISSLGRAAAGFLHETFGRSVHKVIGFGHGRTVAASIEHLPRFPHPGLTVVSVVGGLAQRIDETPFDVIHALAEKTGARAFLPPVPFFANSKADRVVLMRQRGVAEAFEIATRATLIVIGVGEVAPTASMCQTGMVLTAELKQAQRDGAAAEALGSFFDAEGQRIETELHDRLIGIGPDTLVGREVLAVAGGLEKVAAIRAILRTQLISALITDERTAASLVGGPIAGHPPAADASARPTDRQRRKRKASSDA
ncbi:MAG TPA: sugar-binding transcriptional regulator [Acetobacteraceae bacterium]|nr:sugar-binding transcriptional regulator [Acetobacteraceae bacterium]